MYMLKQHKTLGKHLGILNQLEMMVVIDCGGSSTSMTVAQQGEVTCHASMEDANVVVQISGYSISIDLDNKTSRSISAGTDNVSSANEQGCIAAIEAPRVGMVFGSWEEIKIYYR